MTRWIQKIGNSSTGIMVGLLLFIMSLGLFFWNQSRFDESRIAASAEPISAVENTKNQYDRLVAVTGNLKTGQPLGDELYLKPGNYLSIQRNVEQFSQILPNGKSALEECRQEWLSDFFELEQNQDPDNISQCVTSLPPETESTTIVSGRISLGEYLFDYDQTGLPPYESLKLEESIVELTSIQSAQDIEIPTQTDTSQTSPDLQTKTVIDQNYIFIGKGSLTSPLPGDIRISYQVIPADQLVTVFGKTEDGAIVAYKHNDGSTLYTLRAGDFRQAVNSFPTSTRNLWPLRVLSFALLLVSLLILLTPIQGLLSALPWIGDIARNYFLIFTIICALLLSLFTVFFSSLVNNLFLLILILLFGGAILMLFVFLNDHKPKSATAGLGQEQFMDRRKVIDHQAGKIAKAAGVRTSSDNKTKKQTSSVQVKSKKEVSTTKKPASSVKQTKTVATKPAEAKKTETKVVAKTVSKPIAKETKKPVKKTVAPKAKNS